MGHSFFAPSSAPRVVRCPGSLLATAHMPDTAGIDAHHGTAAHYIADKCLREKCHVDKYAGCEVYVAIADGECQFVHEKNRGDIAVELAFGNGYQFEVDDEMVYAVQEYVDWCNELPGEHYPECRVDVSDWCPPVPRELNLPPHAYEAQGGTSDHAACSPGLLVITDLKYGKGVQVFAEENYQAIKYALGFWKKYNWLYDFKRIRIRICQPRLDHKDEWEISVEELLALGAYILERYTLAVQPNAPFNPGEKQCKFCPLSGNCRAQRDYLTAIHTSAFDDITGETKPPAELTTDELVEVWRAHKLYDSFFAGAVAELLRRGVKGEELPGVKIVESNKHRQWIDADLAHDELSFAGVDDDKLYKKTMISPNQAAKLLPKAKRGIVNTLARKPIGDPCLVDAEDKRPDYAAAQKERLDDTFPDLDESE